MFKKKEEKRSIVNQLNDELGNGTSTLYEYIPETFIKDIFVSGITDSKKKEEIDKNRELFADLLSDYIDDRIEKDYTECDECGCLVAKHKVAIVKRGGATLEYCKHCKPPYDEIITEYDYEKEREVVKGYLKNGVPCDESGRVDVKEEVENGK